jgi:hypothetical protein
MKSKEEMEEKKAKKNKKKMQRNKRKATEADGTKKKVRGKEECMCMHFHCPLYSEQMNVYAFALPFIQ